MVEADYYRATLLFKRQVNPTLVSTIERVLLGAQLRPPRPQALQARGNHLLWPLPFSRLTTRSPDSLALSQR